MMSPKIIGHNFKLTIKLVIFYCLIIYIVKLCEGKENLIFLNANAVPDGQFVVPTENAKQDIVTQTVYGFLDFTTTIGNTVMVFSPKSTTTQETSSYIPNTQLTNSVTTRIPEINPSKTTKETSNNKPIMKTATAHIDVIQGSTSTANILKPSKLLSKVEIITSFKESTKIDKEETIYSQNENEQVIPIGNVLDEPEYDFLSRQPSEFVEETFKVMNLKSNINVQPRIRSSVNKKSEHSKVKSNFPTGLVTKVGGTVVKDGATTVHETSVIGTYISGKYAQVLQSSSHVLKYNKPKISTTPTLKVLKTSPPNILLNNRHRVESKVEEQEPVRSTRRPSAIGNFKKGFRNQSKEDDNAKKNDNVATSVEQSVNKATRRVKPKNRRNKNSRNIANNKSSATTTTVSSDGATRRNFKPKHQHSAIDISPSEQTSLYKFKLNRTPGRWQYKTSNKPRINIRKTFNPGDEPNKLASAVLSNSEIISNDIPKRNYNSSTSEETDLESSGSISGAVFNDVEPGNGKIIEEIDRKYPMETLNVEISTAADLKDKYYEIATIKTPYLFQVGSVKRTRYITVTSTYEKTFEPEITSTLSPNEPLTENILASSTQIDGEQNILESSVATLAPLYLSSNEETPPIETRVESFSTTQVVLKTNILPIIRNDLNTTSITLIQTYRITRYVTATKTLPPIEAYEFVPSQRLKEFNSKLDEAGSELNIELDFGDENSEDGSRIRQILPDSDIKEIGSDFDLIDTKAIQNTSPRIAPKVQEVNRNHNSADQLQQLALLGLLNPGADKLQQFMPTPKPVLKLETVYKTEIIPIFNGHSTTFSTISRPITTIQKTEYELPTTTYPQLQLPQPINPFAQQYHLTTAPIISQTYITQTLSKILKLTFGAKTAYTTLFSTNVVPTILTTYVTTSIQVHPTAGIPGYYPSPFAPYPFIG